jgi:hypothetical protein
VTTSRYLPAGVKATLPRRRHGVLELATPKCERCGDPLPEAKYHDCGEQLSISDAVEEANRCQ